jgi:hypothetical protein
MHETQKKNVVKVLCGYQAAEKKKDQDMAGILGIAKGTYSKRKSDPSLMTLFELWNAERRFKFTDEEIISMVRGKT